MGLFDKKKKEEVATPTPQAEVQIEQSIPMDGNQTVPAQVSMENNPFVEEVPATVETVAPVAEAPSFDNIFNSAPADLIMPENPQAVVQTPEQVFDVIQNVDQASEVTMDPSQIFMTEDTKEDEITQLVGETVAAESTVASPETIVAAESVPPEGVMNAQVEKPIANITQEAVVEPESAVEQVNQEVVETPIVEQEINMTPIPSAEFTETVSEPIMPETIEVPIEPAVEMIQEVPGETQAEEVITLTPEPIENTTDEQQIIPDGMVNQIVPEEIINEENNIAIENDEVQELPEIQSELVDNQAVIEQPIDEENSSVEVVETENTNIESSEEQNTSSDEESVVIEDINQTEDFIPAEIAESQNTNDVVELTIETPTSTEDTYSDSVINLDSNDEKNEIVIEEEPTISPIIEEESDIISVESEDTQEETEETPTPIIEEEVSIIPIIEEEKDEINLFTEDNEEADMGEFTPIVNEETPEDENNLTSSYYGGEEQDSEPPIDLSSNPFEDVQINPFANDEEAEESSNIETSEDDDIPAVPEFEFQPFVMNQNDFSNFDTPTVVETQTETATYISEPTPTKFCNNCGIMLTDDSSICPSCGEPID